MSRIAMVLVLAAAGCDALGLNCTQMGCSGTLTIFLDRELAEDAVVTASAGDIVEDCFVGNEGSCEITEVDGEPALVVRTPMGEPAATWTIAVSEGGAAEVEHEVTPVWDDEVFYPNGEQCGGGCTSGEADLTL